MPCGYFCHSHVHWILSSCPVDTSVTHMYIGFCLRALWILLSLTCTLDSVFVPCGYFCHSHVHWILSSRPVDTSVTHMYIGFCLRALWILLSLTCTLDSVFVPCGYFCHSHVHMLQLEIIIWTQSKCCSLQIWPYPCSEILFQAA